MPGRQSCYFDRLPHDAPDRALDLALEVLRTESDKPTLMQLNDKFMLSLLYAHGDAVIDRIEARGKRQRQAALAARRN